MVKAKLMFTDLYRREEAPVISTETFPVQLCREPHQSDHDFAAEAHNPKLKVVLGAVQLHARTDEVDLDG